MPDVIILLVRTTTWHCHVVVPYHCIISPQTGPENGDIVDCIDISSLQESYSKYVPRNTRCTQGYVAIRRTIKEDLIVTEKITESVGSNDPTKNHWRSSNMLQIEGHDVE